MSVKKPSSPHVSVGLPVYNGERYLEAALDSLLGQTYEDFELIVSDNGSTDQTEEICRAYAAADSRVRYYRQDTNRGAVWNFNEVFRKSCGDLFRWAAHDDVCDPRFLETIVSLMDREAECVVGFCRTGLINQNGEEMPTGEGHLNEPDLDQAVPAERLEELLVNRVWLHETYGLIRRPALERTRLLPRYVGGEKILFAELALQGKFLLVPETLFYCRWHSDQASWIESAAEEQRWRDPNSGAVRMPRQVRCFLGQCGAIRRASLSWGQRMRCFAALGKWTMQPGKWTTLARDFWRGMGSSGGRAGACS